MKTDCQLDFDRIVSNRAQLVHLVIQLAADKGTTTDRRPIAFSVVLDRSGSMQGLPLERAKDATCTVVRNLRSEDMFALVVFDTDAQTLFSLQLVKDKNSLINTIKKITDLGSTNLTEGWMFGQTELNKSPAALPRRLMLLSDGHLNSGITEPKEVANIVARGLECNQIRTSCLGFGKGYDETLLNHLATITGGNFYDADNPDTLPGIFASELEGLQKITAANVQIRLQKGEHCSSFEQLGDYPQNKISENIIQYKIGDLMSEEIRCIVLALHIPPLKSFPSPQKLMDIDVTWDEMAEGKANSKQYQQSIFIQTVENASEVLLNTSVLSWIAIQKAGNALKNAMDAMDKRQRDAAQKILDAAIRQLEHYNHPDLVHDGTVQLKEMIQRIQRWQAEDRKQTQYVSSSLSKPSTTVVWTSKTPMPSFKTTPSYGTPVPVHPYQPPKPNLKENLQEPAGISPTMNLPAPITPQATQPISNDSVPMPPVPMPYQPPIAHTISFQLNVKQEGKQPEDKPQKQEEQAGKKQEDKQVEKKQEDKQAEKKQEDKQAGKKQEDKQDEQKNGPART